MSSEERVAVTRRIAAPAAVVFAEVSDPTGHVRIDGSGMLVAAQGGARPSTVGDVFEMDMDRTPLNDLPGVTSYRTANTVTALEPDRKFEWTVGMPGRTPLGYVFGYLIEPVSDGLTDVTSYMDWSGMRSPHKERAVEHMPLISVATLTATLERLESVLAQRA